MRAVIVTVPAVMQNSSIAMAMTIASTVLIALTGWVGLCVWLNVVYSPVVTHAVVTRLNIE